MDAIQNWILEHTAGIILLLGFVALNPGVLMFWLRGGIRGGAPKSQAHFVLERGFIMAAAVISAIGFIMLAVNLQNTPGRVLADIGAVGCLIGGIMIASAEGLALRMGYEKIYWIIIVYVVISFLAEAAVGVALIQSGLVAAWVGWITLLWNLAWLILLPLISPHDLYYPVLHYLSPLLIGIALILK